MTDDKIVHLDVATTLDVDPDKVLDGAKGQLEQCMVIGRVKDSDEYWLASSTGDAPESLWLLEMAKQTIIDVTRGDYD